MSVPAGTTVRTAVFVTREIMKNALMHVPLLSRLRKRLYSMQNVPATEIERQQAQIWSTYRSALESAGILDRLAGRDVLEIGPGPILSTGVRLISRGAASYTGIDRFDLLRTDREVRSSYRDLIAGLDPVERERCQGLILPDDRGPVFDGRMRTEVLSIEEAAMRLPSAGFDLILSYNVLEHVDDVRSALENMKLLMRTSGLMIHRVDVSSHIERTDIHPLWQLTVPGPLWRLMYSVRASPNRVRPAEFLETAARLGLRTVSYEPTTMLSVSSVEEIRPRLRAEYRSSPIEDLRTLDFVWILALDPSG